MDPLLKPQICHLRLPNEREQRRFARSNGWGFLLCALVPLLLLIPIAATPQDPEVPKFVVMMIGAEIGLWLLYRYQVWIHAGSGIYFDARCCGCAARLSYCLGNPRYGLDRKGAFRCRCKTAHVYEKLAGELVQVRPPMPGRRWEAPFGSMLPRAWPAD